MKVWAFEMCYCEYETGYAVQSLHSTKDKATQAMNKRKRRDSGHLYDGYKVIEWEVDGKPVL